MALPRTPGICKDAKSGQAADLTALPTKGSSGHPLVGSGLITQLRHQNRHLLPFVVQAPLSYQRCVQLPSCKSLILDLQSWTGVRSKLCAGMQRPVNDMAVGCPQMHLLVLSAHVTPALWQLCRCKGYIGKNRRLKSDTPSLCINSFQALPPCAGREVQENALTSCSAEQP